MTEHSTQDVSTTKGLRHCADCDVFKPLNDFSYKTVRGTRYRESYCKLCKALRSKAWRQRRKDDNDTTQGE